jgi:hypothetical protein
VPTAKRETALAAFAAQLATGLGPTWTVQRGRDAPFSADRQVSIDEGESALTTRAPAEDRYDCAIEVVVYRAGLVDADIAATLGDTHAAIIAAALSDATLGGAVTHVRQVGMDDPVLESQPGRRLGVVVTIRFEFLLFTKAADPAA